jgi:hypothetical protein
MAKKITYSVKDKQEHSNFVYLNSAYWINRESVNFAPANSKMYAMINHVVLFKLKDFPQAEKQEVREKIKSLLEGLYGKIDELKYIEVGLNVDPDTGAYDICLITHFENMEAFGVYRTHPEHLKAVEYIQATTISRAAVDYSFHN